MSPHARHCRTNRNALASARGAWCEERAAAWCRARNWQIIARNVRCAMGEIDLIALDGEMIVFIEVRLRSRPHCFGNALESITPRKQKRLRAAIEHWLISPEGRHYAAHPMRVDVLAFDHPEEKPIWITNALAF